VTLVDEMRTLQPRAGLATGARVIACCQLVTQLIHTGWTELAEAVMAETVADEGTRGDPAVRAWLQKARADLALHGGDPSAYLKLTAAAAESFARAGDARSACLQRAHLGHAYSSLGAYPEAEQALRGTLAAAEPMGLYVAALAREHLALVLTHTGRWEQAAAIAAQAEREFAEQAEPRLLAMARIYRAIALLSGGDAAGAEREARTAMAVTVPAAGARAFGMAVLAEALRAQGRAGDALTTAREALNLLDYLKSIEQGEAFVRLAYALALESDGHHDEACVVMLQARKKLREQAARIGDEAYRERFLRQIPEHAQTLELAAQWLEDSPPPE
jgi:hypothetical protein